MTCQGPSRKLRGRIMQLGGYTNTNETNFRFFIFDEDSRRRLEVNYVNEDKEECARRYHEVKEKFIDGDVLVELELTEPVSEEQYAYEARGLLRILDDANEKD